MADAPPNTATPVGALCAPQTRRRVYTEADLTVVTDREHVRQRPGMYIGDTQLPGCANELLLSIVDAELNPLDACPHHTQRCGPECRDVLRPSRIGIVLAMDGSASLELAGEGMSVDSRGSSRSVANALGGLFRSGQWCPVHSAWAVANFLSQRCDVEDVFKGKCHTMAFERGDVVRPLNAVGERQGDGLRARFVPDESIFVGNAAVFDAPALIDRIGIIAARNPDVEFSVRDERSQPASHHVFQFGEGATSLHEWRLRAASTLRSSPAFSADVSGDHGSYAFQIRVRCDFVLPQHAEFHTSLFNHPSPAHGPHSSGLAEGLAHALSAHAHTLVHADAVRRCLRATVMVEVFEDGAPHYENRRGVIWRPEIHDALAEAIADRFGKWCEEHPAAATAICELIHNQRIQRARAS